MPYHPGMKKNNPHKKAPKRPMKKGAPYAPAKRPKPQKKTGHRKR